MGRTARTADRGLVGFTLGLGAAVLVLCLPLLIGESTFYYRDLWNLFLPLKSFGASALLEGSIPAVNPTWALGQPFRGNPNALPFYPTNLLYLLLPFWSAFNVHMCAHWGLSAVGMGALARASGRSPWAAVLAAVSYAGSGWMLSSLTFYNLIAVAAWLPILMLGLLRGGLAGAAVAGLAAGLGVLAGEPVTFAVGALGIVAWAIGRLGWRTAAGRLVAAGGVGLLVAAPQIVAMLRVVPFAFRTRVGITPFGASYFSLHPLRLLELVVPLPFGAPGTNTTYAEWTREWLPPVPFHLSIHPGIVALALALLAVTRHRVLALLAAGGWLLAWAGGAFPELLVSASQGLFRSPEKFVVWSALALPLLAAAGLDRALDAAPRAWTRGTMRISVLLGLLAVVVGVSAAVGAVGPWRPLAVQLATAGALLAVLIAGLRSRWRTGVVALQLLGLLQLAPLWMTDRVASFAALSSWAGELPPRPAIVTAHLGYPAWLDTSAPLESAAGPPALDYRVRSQELAAGTGVLHGMTYPLAPDLDGLTHVFYNHLIVRMALADWDHRLPWLRQLGVEALVTRQPVDRPDLELVTRWPHHGVVSWLYRVRDPAPLAWWPELAESVASPREVFDRLATSAAPLQSVFLPFAARQSPGRVLSVRSEADRVELEVESGGGFVVVRRAFQSLWEARTGDQELRIVPANLALLGVEVPPGRHRVQIEISNRPERLATLISASGLLLLALVFVLRRRLRGAPGSSRRSAPRVERGAGTEDPPSTTTTTA